MRKDRVKRKHVEKIGAYKTGIQKIIKKYRENGTLNNHARRGKPPTVPIR